MSTILNFLVPANFVTRSTVIQPVSQSLSFTAIPIRARVYLWQGEEDISVPPSMGRYMAENIPNCEAEFIKEAGHFWIFEHLPEMLARLVSENDG